MSTSDGVAITLKYRRPEHAHDHATDDGERNRDHAADERCHQTAQQQAGSDSLAAGAADSVGVIVERAPLPRHPPAMVHTSVDERRPGSL
jgi:hypothetical protein